MDNILIKQSLEYDLDKVYADIKEMLLTFKINEKLNNNSTVLIKPNMLTKQVPSKNVTTHPVVLEAVILSLFDFGIKAENILVADSSGGPCNQALQIATYKTCGFTAVCQKHNVSLYNKLSSVTIKTDGLLVKEFEVIEPIMEYDFIINLTKFKTHVMTGMTGAVKNMFGVIQGLKKAELHMRFPDKYNFADMLLDLSLIAKADFTIVDAIQGMEGDGPAGGKTRNIGMLIAGENPYKIDHIIATLMGFEPMALPVLKRSIERGFVDSELEENTVIGDTHLYKKLDNFIKPASYSIDFSGHTPRAIRWAVPMIEKVIAPKPKVNTAKCIGCGKCKDICPKQVITIDNKIAKIDLNSCIRCFCCHEMCPVKAIDVKRSKFFNI